jgi:uncharacterized protein YecT (DUF1311 family)
MRVMVLFLAAFLLPLAANSEPAAQTNTDGISLSEEDALLDECNWQQSQDEVRDCLGKIAAESARKLADSENELLSRISTRWGGQSGSDWMRKYDNIAVAKFKQSRNAFVLFRKKECDFYQSMAGSARSISLDQRQYSCQFSMNFRRMKQLREYLEEISPEER